MATTKYWKVWLTPNLLTKDVDNDYIAEVSTSKHTLRNEDIAQRIVAEGSEIKYDTLLSIINQRNALSVVGVEVLGVKESGGAEIGLVTDTVTGNTDGTITPAMTSSSKARKSR